MYKSPLFWFAVLVFVGAATVVVANFGRPAGEFSVFVVNASAKAAGVPFRVAASFWAATLAITTSEFVRFIFRTRKGVQQV